MIFDLVLDTNIEKKTKRILQESNSKWMWYPNQRVAHLHRIKIEQSIKRFSYIGYPGSFRQPVYSSYYKKSIKLEEDTLITWDSLGGRIRMNVNGLEYDITTNNVVLKKGKTELLVSIDFTNTLPALFIKCDNNKLLDNWLVSIDRNSWMIAESMKEFNDINKHPLQGFEDEYIIKPDNIKEKSNALIKDDCIILEKDGYIIVDFYYYELGYVSFKTKGRGNILMHVGQSKEEVLNRVEEDFEQKQIGSIELTDHYKNIVGHTHATRYALIKTNGNAKIENIRFHAFITPVEYVGSFDCSDEELNNIWYMGCATVHSCMHDFFLDTIYRDSLPWALDGVGAMIASDMVFFDKQIRRQQIISQLMPSQATKEDLGVVYLDFQLYTILGFECDYLATGDKNFLLDYKEEIYKTVDIYCEILDDKGFLSSETASGMSFFPDWAVSNDYGPDILGTPAYAQMILMHVLEFTTSVADIAGDIKRTKMYNQQAELLRNNIIDKFWDDERKLFINGLDRSGNIDDNVSIYAQAFGVIFDLVSVSDYDSIHKAMIATREERKNLSINFAWEMMALSKLGKSIDIINYLKDMILPIITSGDVRVYEDINFSKERTLSFYGRTFGKSLCHSVMGAAPVIGINYGVVGIIPDNEYNTFILRPSKSHLEWIKSVVPANDGLVRISQERDLITLEVIGRVRVKLTECRTQEGLEIIDQEGVYYINL